MNHLLTYHAARGYGVPQYLVERVLGVRDPFPIPEEFCTSANFRGDPHTPEHNAYLVARWVATLRLGGWSDGKILKELCTVNKFPLFPWYRRLWNRIVSWHERTKASAWRYS